MLKEKRVFEVTRGQLWTTLVIAAIALAIVFELGVWVGKRRVISAERELTAQYNAQIRENAERENSRSVPQASPPEQTEEASKTENKAKSAPGKYTIQVGTFRSRQNAADLSESLVAQEHESWLETDLNTGEALYCVFLGRFETKEEAEQYVRSLQEQSSDLTGYRIRELRE